MSLRDYVRICYYIDHTVQNFDGGNVDEFDKFFKIHHFFLYKADAICQNFTCQTFHEAMADF